MNSEFHQRLEREIDRELKTLPELTAPATLLPRVLAAIQRQAALPWYRRPWLDWPMSGRLVAFTVLLAAFGGICFGGWQLSHANEIVNATNAVGRWFAGFAVVWDTVCVLVNAVVLVVEKLGTGFMVACLILAGFSYLACIALGTAFFRYAIPRR